MDGRPETGPLHRRARRGLAYVTEERSVFKGLSLVDNLRCGGVEVADALALFPELGSAPAGAGAAFSPEASSRC